jgi:hypothetical protein
MTTSKHPKARKKTFLEDAARVTPGYEPSSSIQRPDLAVPPLVQVRGGLVQSSAGEQCAKSLIGLEG